MKHLLNLCLFFAVALIFNAPTETEAHDRGKLSARANKGFKGVSFKKRCEPFRVNDCGKPIRCWGQQVKYRNNNDTFIYRYEGRASAREDESCPVMMFHIKCDRKIRCGHVYQRRDN